jgi:hypothetical protein
LGKSQVKAAKIYIRDTGVLHTLLQVRAQADLKGQQKFGAVREGFALEHNIRGD